MVRVFVILLPAIATFVAAAPLRFRPRAFSLQDYANFQISDGTAGNAQAEAEAVFVSPFAGQDLATISDEDQDNIETMRKAAEAAETDQFNPAIEAASGADADALQAGKIKNKVLKLTGEVQVLQIKLAKAQAAGDDITDLESKLDEEQTKLDKNIATDKASAGDASKGVTGGAPGAAASSSPASNDTGNSASSDAASATKVATAAASTKSTLSKTASASTTKATDTTNQAAAGTFKLQDYAAFQISDGTAGNAQAEAEAIFVTPFAGQDLATISDQTQDDIESMRQAAEAAETDKFNPAIKAASGADADALQVGKIKNKVLKLTGEVQVLKIKLAKAQASGGDTASIQSKLDAEQTKLDKNISTDKASAGDASKSVA